MAVKRALITGVTGQDGSYLAEFLLARGYEVHGIKRRGSSFNTQRVDHLIERPEFKLHYGDLTDAGSLAALVSLIDPDEVYNLAAQSHVGVSFEMPDYTAETIALGTLRLLEAIRWNGRAGVRIYQASSSEMFGNAPAPQSESTPFRPRSPYGCAKLFAHEICRNYRDAYGMKISCGILFNHESPRRGETFVTRKITRAVARIAHGLDKCLHLGNLDAWRDWGFAADYVGAMWAMLQVEPDDFVIGTGVSSRVSDFARLAFEHIGADWQRYVVGNDPRYVRPAEVDCLLADPTKARLRLGWQPALSLKGLVALMVSHDLQEVQKTA